MITKTSANKLDKSKVRVVDFAYSNTNSDTDKFNIIFRSNIPEDKTYSIFEYDLLVEYMIEIAMSEKLLKIEKEDVYIMDFTLLKETDPMKTTEMEYFQNNKEKGEVRGWSVLGEKKNPADYTLDEIIKKSKDLKWMRDPVEEWIDEIRKTLLDFSKDKHLLILVHCHYGKDRTGEIAGGYELKYGHQSWKEVAATNWEMYKGSIVYDNQRALTWFCYHLQYHQGYSHLNCTNENLSKKDEIKPEMVGWDIEGYDDTDNWEIAFFALLASSIFGIFIVFIVVVLIGLFLSRKMIGRKVADIGEFVKNRRNNNSNNNNGSGLDNLDKGYENVQMEKSNQIGDIVVDFNQNIDKELLV